MWCHSLSYSWETGYCCYLNSVEFKANYHYISICRCDIDMNGQSIYRNSIEVNFWSFWFAFGHLNWGTVFKQNGCLDDWIVTKTLILGRGRFFIEVISMEIVSIFHI